MQPDTRPTLTPSLSGGDDLTTAGTPADEGSACAASRLTPAEELDLRIARTLLNEALTRLGRVEGKSGVAGALGALIGRLYEPPPQPLRPPDLWTDVCRAIHGVVAVCLAQGIEREMACCIRDTFAAAIADDIKLEVERRAKEAGRG